MCAVQLKQDVFGQITDAKGQKKAIQRFTWTNKTRISVQLINYGGYITSIKVPDREGKVDDIVIGFDKLEGYLQPQNAYFGATIGRGANRIGGSKMTIEGVTYQLPANDGPNHLHGGFKGFDKVIWDYHVDGTQVVLSYLSPDLEEGYPGDVLAQVTFELTEQDEFLIDYKAMTTKPTYVNLTNHSYFNLAGHSTFSLTDQLYKHVISINADSVLEVDSQGIPTGTILPVSDTTFDLRIPKVIGDVVHKVPNSPGYDHNYCLTRGSEQGNAFVARVSHPGSGRVLEIYSNQPGVQFYTGNFLPEDNSLKGKAGKVYKKHGAFCLETQIYPDAVNHENFGKAVLYPGEQYHHTAKYKFLTEPLSTAEY